MLITNNQSLKSIGPWRIGSLLSYPGGIPGVNIDHFAAKNLRFAAVALGPANMIDLLTGGSGALTGTPTALTTPFGPSCVFSTIGQHLAYSGKSTGLDAVMCMAMVFTPVTDVANRGYLATSSGANGYSFQVDGTGNLRYNVDGVVSITSAVTIAINTPYFAAMSGRTGSQSFLIRRLDTGAITTGTTATAYTAIAPSGISWIGDTNGLGHCGARINAVMMSANYFTVPQLMQWAEDPWAFWYQTPNVLPMMMMSPSTAPPVIAGGAIGLYSDEGLIIRRRAIGV